MWIVETEKFIYTNTKHDERSHSSKGTCITLDTHYTNFRTGSRLYLLSALRLTPGNRVAVSVLTIQTVYN